jgi:hypothetical protein
MIRSTRAVASVVFPCVLPSRSKMWRLCHAAMLAAAYSVLGCESGPVTSSPAHEPAAAPGSAVASPPSPAPAGSPAPGSSAGNTPAGSTAAAGAKPTVSRFGAAIDPGPTVALASLLSDPKTYASQTVTTEGRVQRACSRKGCWMEIGEGEDACRVTFKDYGFFVPTDSAGAYAKIQGKLDTREVEPAAVEHLESEGARFRNKRSDGSATEVRLIASAVELKR